MEAAKGIWNYCTNSSMRRATRQLGQLYDDIMQPIGLKGTQFSLIAQIAALGDPSLKTLAETMVMDLSGLGHTLKPLARDGLVELVTDEKDRRVKRARLTPLGTARYAEGVELWREAQGRFDAVFGAERSALLRETMAEIASTDFAHAFRKDPAASDKDGG